MNDRWLCASPTEVPTVTHRKLQLSVMILEVVDNEEHVMLPYFFLQSLKVKITI